MRIKKLTLQSNDIARQVSFFKDTLGFTVERSENLLSIVIGNSTLEFIDVPVDGKYHYCFLIPCNQIEEAKVWLSQKLELILVENHNYIAHFDTWNADSIYFYDGNGNIAELIARHDLINRSDKKFGLNSFLSINEIGTPTSDTRRLDHQLTNEIGSEFWKGNLDTFSTNGNQHGLFLLPNYLIKKTWFPTPIKVMPLPYTATIIQDENQYQINYKNENMQVEFLK